MKKVAIVFLFLIGFVLVFIISGMVAFTIISDNTIVTENATDVVDDIEVPIYNPLDSDGNKIITRVTPGLTAEDTIITYGDEVYKEEEDTPVPEAQIVDNEPDLPSQKPAEAKQETKAETQKEEVKTETKKETKMEEVKTETKKEEVKTETKKEEVKEEAPKVEEKPKEEAPKQTEEVKKEEEAQPPVTETPKAEEPKAEDKVQNPVEEPKVEETPKVELNPNIQTSDTGL